MKIYDKNLRWHETQPKKNLKNKRSLKHNDQKIIRPFSHQYPPDKRDGLGEGR